jgi:hypothetical protein
MRHRRPCGGQDVQPAGALMLTNNLIAFIVVTLILVGGPLAVLWWDNQ